MRGLHISQARRQARCIAGDELTSASLFDTRAARLSPGLRASQASAMHLHSEIGIGRRSAVVEGALRRNDRGKGLEAGLDQGDGADRSIPIAYEMEEFLFNLRDYILGIESRSLGLHGEPRSFQLNDPNWLLPDRNTIPFDVPFFQNLRTLMPEITHKHGALAIGGMTALFPDRSNPELNARALEVLERDKKNEANCLMDGAWTGHPDQNEIAVAQFPFPNQLERRPKLATDASRLAACTKGRRQTDTRGHARCRAHGHSLSPRRAQGPRREPARRLHGRSRHRPHLSPDDRATLALPGPVHAALALADLR